VAQAIIRDVVEADLPRVVELLVQLSPDVPHDDPGPPLPSAYGRAFEEITVDSRQRLLVLEVEGRILGTLALIIVPNLTHGGRPYAIVENVVVDSSERGNGHGEALMRFAMAEAELAGCYKLALTSNKQRADAHRFYRRLGFETRHEGFRIDF
jgi:GNAT superfamily N-acetyltransferase